MRTTSCLQHEGVQYKAFGTSHDIPLLGSCALTCRESVAGDRALVVAFGSAPGVPNWGGLLSRVLAAAEDAAHECFDVLYVVDPARSWYSGEALPLANQRHRPFQQSAVVILYSGLCVALSSPTDPSVCMHGIYWIE